MVYLLGLGVVDAVGFRLTGSVLVVDLLLSGLAPQPLELLAFGLAQRVRIRPSLGRFTVGLHPVPQGPLGDLERAGNLGHAAP